MTGIDKKTSGIVIDVGRIRWMIVIVGKETAG